MDYTSRINRALDYIDRHLDDKLTIRAVARVACLSPHHFDRVFASRTGESLYAAIVRLRVERVAAVMVDDAASSITELALRHGFNDSATFSRAFKRRFGIAARVWRQQKGKIRQVGGASRWQPRVRAAAVEPLSTRIETRTETVVAYLRHTGPFEGDARLFARLWAGVERWANARGLDRGSSLHVAVYHDALAVTDALKVRVSVGVTVPPGTSVDGRVDRLALGAGPYLACTYRLQAHEYGAAWSDVYGRWLERHRVLPDDGYAFESYPAHGYDPAAGTCLVELWVPVKRSRMARGGDT